MNGDILDEMNIPFGITDNARKLFVQSHYYPWQTSHLLLPRKKKPLKLSISLLKIKITET